MNLMDKTLSRQFYTYVCGIVGSEEIVRTRREIFTAKDIVQNTSSNTVISSGSKAEGLDIKGSDYDQMMLMNFIRVYESFDELQYNPDKILLVMDTVDTKPGFTKLRLFNKLNLHNIPKWCETVGADTYISSKRFRDDILSLNPDLVIHGPCQTLANGEIDHAICFRCNEWITPAQQWIDRSRAAWPHDTLVSSAVEYGVLCVPIGCKSSPNEDLQWRMSFSVTEKRLIFSFTHTQLLCYALMKIILKDLIKPRHGDLLCSYFLKTIMFWLSEEINSSEWKPANMIPCFFECIRRLIYCVEYKTCLHYFIPENNLFEDKFTDKEHKALLNTLRSIYESPLMYVFETSTFQHFRLESVSYHGIVLSASELSCYAYLGMTAELSINIAIARLVNGPLNKELCIYMLSLNARNVLESSHLCNVMNRNKLFYQQYKRALCYLKISLRSSSMSSWLLLASIFYNCKRFQECLDIINYCLFSCNPFKIYLHFGNSFAEQTVFNQTKQKWGLLHAFKYLMFENVWIRHQFNLLPEELKSLVVGNVCIIPPVVYSYLLQFLCFNQLGNNRRKNDALHNLELTVREQFLIFPLTDTSRIVHESLEIVRSLI